MSDKPFADYYETLQVSPHAEAETIERMFRHLATRFHPDSPETHDQERFSLVVEAHETLSDPVKRAGYDARYEQERKKQYSVLEEASGRDDVEHDKHLRLRALTLLYVQRRRDMAQPGIGDGELRKMLNCVREHLEFHLWYLRERGFLERTDGGYLAITAAGVEHVEQNDTWLSGHKMLPPDASSDAEG